MPLTLLLAPPDSKSYLHLCSTEGCILRKRHNLKIVDFRHQHMQKRSLKEKHQPLFNQFYNGKRNKMLLSLTVMKLT